MIWHDKSADIFRCAILFSYLSIKCVHMNLFIAYIRSNGIRSTVLCMFFFSFFGRLLSQTVQCKYMEYFVSKITLDHRVIALSLLLRLLAIPLESAIWMFLVVSKHITSIGWCTITDIHVIHIHVVFFVCVSLLSNRFFFLWTVTKPWFLIKTFTLNEMQKSAEPTKQKCKTTTTEESYD